MSKKYLSILVSYLLITSLTNCSLFSSPAEPPTLPDLAGYEVIEGQALSDYLQLLGAEAAGLTLQPELLDTVEHIDQIIACYQGTEAIQARIYSHETNPLSAGTVAIADRNALLNPLNLFNCVAPQDRAAFRAQALVIEPCTANYAVSRDNNEYYIVYAGTMEAVCQAFCEQLEGCTEHK